MLGEITHLQAIIDDLTVLTTDPHKLPAASEQVTPLSDPSLTLPVHDVSHLCPLLYI